MKAEMEEMQKKSPVTGSGGAAESSMYFLSLPYNRLVDANSKQYKTLILLDGWREVRVRRNEVIMAAKLLYHIVGTPISDSFHSAWIKGRLTSC